MVKKGERKSSLDVLALRIAPWPHLLFNLLPLNSNHGNRTQIIIIQQTLQVNFVGTELQVNFLGTVNV